MPQPRLLVVEDDPGVRTTIVTCLELEGYTVDAASSTKEAIDRLSAGSYPIVISDIYATEERAKAGDFITYSRRNIEPAAELLGRLRARYGVYAVLGNHDYESGQETELIKMMTTEGIKVLDGSSYERDGIGFAGTKGFPGGFGRGALTAFGEPEVKAFVQAAIDESHIELAAAATHAKESANGKWSKVKNSIEGRVDDMRSDFAKWQVEIKEDRAEQGHDTGRVQALHEGEEHHRTPDGPGDAGRDQQPRRGGSQGEQAQCRGPPQTQLPAAHRQLQEHVDGRVQHRP